MSDQFLKFEAPAPARAPDHDAPPLGQILLRNRVLTEAQLSQAVTLQDGMQLPLGEVCMAQGYASPQQIAEALSEQRGLQSVDLAGQIPDRRLLALRPAQFWLRHRAVPRAQLGSQLLVATSRPEHLDTLADGLQGAASGLLPAVAPEEQVLTFLSRHCQGELARQASLRVSARFSCRTLAGPRSPGTGLAAAAALTTAAGLLEEVGADEAGDAAADHDDFAVHYCGLPHTNPLR